MRALVTAVASVAMALSAFGLAVAAPHAGRPNEPRAALASSSGALRISNSREGRAVFSTAGMRPGGVVSGSVRIGNDGGSPGRFSVLATDLADAPGPYGGRLSERLQLVLTDVTDPQRPLIVYSGAPAGFGASELGTFAPGAVRDYLVSATLPDGGLPASASAGDNRYQGSALSVGLEWRGVSDPVAPLPPPPSAPPAVTAGPPPAPLPPSGAGAVEPAGEALADALGLPRSARCVKRRRLTVRLRTPNRARVVAATIAINGRVRARVSGAKAGAPVKLRRLPKRRFKLSVSVRGADGRGYASVRSYRACRSRAVARRLERR